MDDDVRAAAGDIPPPKTWHDIAVHVPFRTSTGVTDAVTVDVTGDFRGEYTRPNVASSTDHGSCERSNRYLRVNAHGRALGDVAAPRR